MSSSLFLLFLVVLSPLCLARNLPASPSPSPVLAEQPELPSPSQAPQMSGYSIEPPSSSPSQPPQAHEQEPKYPFEPPSPSPAPQANLEPENPFEPPSPSQAPLAPGYPNEPPSPSPAPQVPQYPKFKLPPSSPSHGHHHGHYHHHHHEDQPPRQIPPPGLGSTPILQCWAPTLDVAGCVDDIKMAYHDVKYDIAPKCCLAINKTSDECLFNMLYYRTRNPFFILWLREHCSHLPSV